MGPYGWTSRLFATDLIRIGWCEGFLGRCSTNQRLAICILTLPDFLRQYLCDLHFCKQLRTTFAWFQVSKLLMALSRLFVHDGMLWSFHFGYIHIYIYMYIYVYRYTYGDIHIHLSSSSMKIKRLHFLEHQIQELGGDAWHLSSLEAQSWWQYLSGVRGR